MGEGKRYSVWFCQTIDHLGEFQKIRSRLMLGHVASKAGYHVGRSAASIAGLSCATIAVLCRENFERTDGSFGLVFKLLLNLEQRLCGDE